MNNNFDGKSILQAIKDGKMTAEEGLKLFKREKDGKASLNGSTVNETVPPVHKRGIDGVNMGDLKEKAIEYLKGVLSKELDIPHHKIDAREALEKYGIDSVMVVGLTRELESKFGELSKTLFFEYQTIHDLAGYFAENHTEKLLHIFGMDAPAPIGENVLPESRTVTEKAKHVIKKAKREIENVQFKRHWSMEQDDIAIVGVNGRYPMARNLEEFWENLKASRDCITEIPPERWNHEEFYDPERGKKGKSISKWGGFIDDVDKFDPLFFNISPMEAEFMDPQERLFLETVWHAFEDAGYTRKRLSGVSVGVFVGIMYGHYQLYGAEESLKGNVIALSSSYASIANRISYYFNFHGPSIGLDTMCSSSLTAIHLASESLKRGECAMAVAGGVNVTIHPNKYILLNQGNFASSDGRCRSFGEGGDGYVPGEGVGAVILKRLSDAVKDGDRIYAVIKGSAVNHGGKTNGYTVPNPNAQDKLISEAIRKSGINPRSISYIEAHGTGTSLGDPIEIASLTKAFSEYTKEKQFCAIGSVKSNIGHLESAAGIAGLTKVLLQMKHRQLVPSIHSETLNPNINFKETPFVVQRTLDEWKQPEIQEDGIPVKYLRRAGISSFGAGGSNAHIILEEYIHSEEKSAADDPGPFIVPISAKNEERLKEYVSAMLRFFENHDGLDLKRIAYTFQVGREAMTERLGIVVYNIGELKNALKGYLNGNIESFNIFRGSVSSGDIKHDFAMDGVEGEEFVRNLVRNKKFISLAKLWSRGFDIDWEMLYDTTPLPMTLPFYPFARERYWVPVSEEQPTAGAFKPLAAFGPMIDSNESTLEEQCYKKVLTGKEFYLSDHVVNGRSVMPGAAFLEMARSAGDLAVKGLKTCKIKDVVFHKVLAVGEQPVETYVRLVPGENDVEFKITDIEETENSVVYCSGRLEYAYEPENSISVNRKDAFSQYHGMNRIDRNEYYKRMQGAGFNYKNTFKTIKAIYYNSTEAVAELELDEKSVKESVSLKLHPSVLDGAFQSVVPLVTEKIDTKRDLYFPYSIKEIALYAPLEKKCRVHATFESSGTEKGQTCFSFHLRIANEEGSLLAEIWEYTVKRSEFTPNSFNLEEEQVETILCTTVWKESNSARPETRLTGDLLVFEKEGRIGEAIREVPGIGAVAVVIPGSDFKEKEGLVFEICPGREEDYDKLLKSLSAKGFNISQIAHFWSTAEVAGNGKKEKEIFEESAISLILLSKSLMKTGNKKRIKLLFGCFGKEGSVLPQYAAVSGILKTVSLENPSILCKTVMFDSNFTMAQIPAVLALEFSEGMGKETEVKYSDGRYVKKAVELNVKQDLKIDRTLKEGSVCLITGGLGGLGMIFAKHLAKTIKARLVLSGRSPMSAAKDKIIELEKEGAEVVYIKADISKKEEAFLLVEKAKEHFGRIDCVIHSAGVLKDSLLINKTIGDLDAVIAPKVLGTFNLEEALRSSEPEYFILFSSVTGLTGNVGQADYAYANSFIDYFAESRRRLKGSVKTVSINWPLWKDGGMSPDERSIQWMKTNLGMWPISVENGIKAFHMALSMDFAQLIVLEGNGGKLRRFIDAASENIEEERTEHSKVASYEKEKNELDEKLKERAISFLKNLLSKEMRISPDRLDAGEALEKYGIDSIMVVRLTRELEVHFGQLPKTLFFEYSNISQLAGYFIDNHRETLIKKVGLNFEEKEKIQETKEITPATVQEKYFRKRFVFSVTEEGDNNPSTGDIAIIGFSGRFPMADNVEEFWENLKAGKDCITEIPSERWDCEKDYDPEKGKKGKTYSKWGGFINKMDRFDPLFFNISPVEAHIMDPQERLFLQTVWHTMEDAGYTREKLSRYSVGVFVGVMYGHYQLYGAEESMKGNGIALSSSFASIANRVSYFLNLRGPSIAMDTMCSSSLTSFHIACESIKRGECDMAFAGGVNLSVHPNKYILLSQGKFFSSDGRCRSFGEGGDGYVPGEGVGAVLLKPLHKAEQDGDRIYGVIKATVLNHGGKTNGYTVPNPNAQAELIEKALNKAGINARTISCLEAHGTGTALGDPIEITGLVKAFEVFTKDKHFCSIGSVKSNIGHLESAAGIAGIIKVLLQLKYKQLVPSLHSENLNSNIDFENTPFYVQRKLEEWKRTVILENGVEKDYPRRAGVSSFGAGGANAHVIIEEYAAKEKRRTAVVNPSYLFTLSAKNRERLVVYASKILDYLQKNAGKPSANFLKEPELHTFLTRSIIHILSDITFVAAEHLDPSESIGELGLDPMSVTELANRLNDMYGLNLDAAILHGSPEEIANMLLDGYGENFRQNYKFEDLPVSLKDKNAIDLEAMAFTLQTGREAMEERLAIIASEQEELEEKLSAFISGKSHIEGVYSGNIKDGKEKTALLLDSGKAGREFMKVIMDDHDCDKLAKLWVTGIDIDFGALYKDAKPDLVSLPLYPFAEERYWIPQASRGEAAASASSVNKIGVDPGERVAMVLKKIWKPSRQLQDMGRRIQGIIVFLVNEESAGAISAIARKFGNGFIILRNGDEYRVLSETEIIWDFSSAVQGLRVLNEFIGSRKDVSAVIDISDCYEDSMDNPGSFAGKVTFLQQAVKSFANQGLTVLHFTRGLNTFQNKKPTLSGSVFAGFVKMLGGEYRKVISRTVDIDFNLQDVALLERVVLRELQENGSYGETCYRNGKRYVPSFCEAEYAESTGLNVSPEGVWVVTGGTRGIGAKVASMLVEKGARNLVIMGIQPIPIREEWEHLLKAETSLDMSERIKTVMELEKRGARVSVYSGSLNDLGRLEDFFEKVRTEMGTIEGIIHCAGLSRNENPAFVNKKQEDIMSVLEPKTEGLMNLHRIFEGNVPRHFILFSSISASVPLLASGLSDYAAANAFMDYFASYQHAMGNTYYKSIGWPNWKETGMGQGTSPIYSKLGLTSLKTSEGLELLDMLAGMERNSYVMPCLAYEYLMNPAVLPKIRHGTTAFSAVVPDVEQKERSIAVKGTQMQDNAEKPDTENRSSLNWLKTLFAKELGIPMERLDEEKNFGDYGVDSILIAELVKKMEGELNVKIEPSALLEHPTLKELSEYIDDKFGRHVPVSPSEKLYTERIRDKYEETQNGEKGSETGNMGVALAAGYIRAGLETESVSHVVEPIDGNGMKIAVIGMACNFPLASTTDEYWENLKSGRDCITIVKKSRWDADKYFSPVYQKGKTYSKWGGFIDDIEMFDPKYFNLDEELAPHMDPLVRQFMEVSVQALRDAGYEKEEVWGKKVGVFAGSRTGNFSGKIPEPIKSTIIGTGQNFIAAHVSHFFNFKGPGMVVDTACSSSLVSIHLACQSLMMGESEMALAGGVDILLDEKTYIVLSESGALSPDGKCHTFDEKANGFVPGEGCGVVVLKPLDRALADGDRIYAVIESSAVNNDGHTMGITTPNPAAQEEVIREALNKAGISAASIGYVEAHGTGTMIGDPIELKALTNVFKQYTEEKGFCAIGSVKTNIGHLLSAAGIASFIKVVLSIVNKQIPPTLNCERPNPRFKFEQSPFFPNTSLIDWQSREGIRRSGISSFGFGGTNAHVIVSEYTGKDRIKERRHPLPPVVFNRKRYWIDSGNPIESDNYGGPSEKPGRILEIIDETEGE